MVIWMNKVLHIFFLLFSFIFRISSSKTVIFLCSVSRMMHNFSSLRRFPHLPILRLYWRDRRFWWRSNISRGCEDVDDGLFPLCCRCGSESTWITSASLSIKIYVSEEVVYLNLVLSERSTCKLNDLELAPKASGLCWLSHSLSSFWHFHFGFDGRERVRR